MTDFNLPSIFVPLVGLVFLAIEWLLYFFMCRKIRLSSIF